MQTPQAARSQGRSAAAGTRVDTSVDLPGLIDTLIRRRKIIAFCTVLFAGLGFLGLFLISPRYTATARILIDPREQRVMQNEVVQQGFGTDMALVESQGEVITSEAVLKRVVKNTGLATDREFAGSAASTQDPSVNAIEALAAATKVARPENTYVLEISVTTKEAIKSARLANAVAAAYLEYQADTTAGTARDVSTSIRDRLSQLQTELRKSEEEVEAFKREHNVSQSEGQLLGDRSLTDLATRQSAAQARANEAKARLDVMQAALKSRGDVAAVVADTDATMVALRTQLAEAQRNLAELQQVLGPRHPQVAAARGQIAQAQASIRAESARLVRSAQDDYRASMDALDGINSSLASAKTNSFDTNKDLIKLRELQRKADSDKVVYEAFLVRAKETAEQENLSTPNARVIGAAAVPSAPAFPPRAPMLLAAIVLGLFIGILVAILRDLAAGRSNVPLATATAPAGKAEMAIASGLVTVASLRDPLLSRQAALALARDALSSGRNVILVDLAADAPADVAGFAELATGRMPASDVIKIGRTSGVQMLGAGRKDALAEFPLERVGPVLTAISDEYDDVVVNLGAFNSGLSTLAEASTRYSQHLIMAVNEGEFGPREEHAAKMLAANSDTALSVVSVEDGDIVQAA
ncbi:GumC family protein [Mesorhizobium sp. ES1-1]|uniref:GumC family protein n=1 Tax=Mesorhizobium sp. ES1-1 TaxID=2876629 RepID=UPI001CCEB15B|nr:GumC family protein [Mesorhizobium sp. ES1-1]MBZ9674378.1 GumC family protein [Mesorhizobium sp. ES1-1]